MRGALSCREGPTKEGCGRSPRKTEFSKSFDSRDPALTMDALGVAAVTPFRARRGGGFCPFSWLSLLEANGTAGHTDRTSAGSVCL